MKNACLKAAFFQPERSGVPSEAGQDSGAPVSGESPDKDGSPVGRSLETV